MHKEKKRKKSFTFHRSPITPIKKKTEREKKKEKQKTRKENPQIPREIRDHSALIPPRERRDLKARVLPSEDGFLQVVLNLTREVRVLRPQCVQHVLDAFHLAGAAASADLASSLNV